MSNRNTVLNQVLNLWLKGEYSGLIPSVDCVNCSQATAQPVHAERWSKFKCCTFQPFVANFYCGAMLEAGLSLAPLRAGRSVKQALGILAPADFRRACAEVSDERRGEEHLCSFYDSLERRCSIWRFRPGECSLFYCTDDSRRMKREELSQKIFQFEAEVAQMALAHVGFTGQEVLDQVEILNDPPDSLVDTQNCEDIYRRAWSWVKNLSVSEVMAFTSFDKPSPTR